MINLLKTLHDRAEEYKGKRLLVLLAIIFVIFALLGIFFGYIVSTYTGGNITEKLSRESNVKDQTGTIYEGRISYIDPNTYPNDNISYILLDKNGKQIILLRAQDQKLVVAEGYFAKVTGSVVKTIDGKKDVLEVAVVILKNVSN